MDAVCDGEDVLIGGIMEHIEQAGVHSGDSGCSLPPNSLSREIQDELRAQTRKLAKALNVVGLMNIQFAIQNGVIYVLEVNPRASRTVPFVSKATGVPLAKIAARVMTGRKLAQPGATVERIPPYFSVKEAVFPFVKFPEADPILGPEMKSTGEVMGTGRTFGEAYAKAQAASGVTLPRAGCASSACATATSRARAARAEADRARLRGRRHRRHRALAQGGRHRLPPRQQGARGAPAHRRHDQERRDRPDRQHHRRQAGHARVALDPPRGGAAARHLLHHPGRRPAPPARRSTISTRSRSTGCRTCTSEAAAHETHPHDAARRGAAARRS